MPSNNIYGTAWTEEKILDLAKHALFLAEVLQHTEEHRVVANSTIIQTEALLREGNISLVQLEYIRISAKHTARKMVYDIAKQRLLRELRELGANMADLGD